MARRERRNLCCVGLFAVVMNLLGATLAAFFAAVVSGSSSGGSHGLDYLFVSTMFVSIVLYAWPHAVVGVILLLAILAPLERREAPTDRIHLIGVSLGALIGIALFTIGLSVRRDVGATFFLMGAFAGAAGGECVALGLLFGRQKV
jgi:ABC-type cobalamin transport system permease subunit